MPLTATQTRDRTVTNGAPNAKARPLLRLTGPDSGEYLWIDNGKQGSLQTAFQMARLVREDVVRDEGLQVFAAGLLIKAGIDSHTDKGQIAGLLCSYVQAIPYINDPSGAFDSVSSARTTLAKGFGDCDDLAVLLATLLALVGLQPRFVLARYKRGTKGYDHVYVDVVLAEGARMALDPCSRRNGPGWESPNAIERLTFPIFAFPTTSLHGALELATMGAQAGANFIPFVGPAVSMLIGPALAMFSRTVQRGEEAARDEYKDEVLHSMDSIKAAVDSCQITPAQGQAAAKQLITAFYSACDKFTKKSVAASCRNYEKEDVPGGAQEGAFNTKQARIASAGGRCNVSGATSVTGGTSGAGGISIGGSSFPILLLVAGGAVLYFISQR